jgi:hypothetical protein
VHHHRLPIVEDRVILRFTVIGRGELVEMFVPEIPTARTLQEIAADGGGVSDLRGGRVLGGFRERSVLFQNAGVARDFRQSH